MDEYGDEIEPVNESREVYDEVKQLDYRGDLYSSPGADSGGNLNVKALLNQQQIGRRKQARP